MQLTQIRRFTVAVALTAALSAVGCAPSEEVATTSEEAALGAEATTASVHCAGADSTGITVTASPTFPTSYTGSDLTSASQFAWQEFIALNWPAIGATDRDAPDTSKLFGDPSYSGPVVWQTFRHKVEIYPGTGNPNGYVDDASKDYGYDSPPEYIYAETVPACDASQAGESVPWVNLDEQSEIGLDQMYAGAAPSSPFPGQEILFLAKANRAEYVYAAGNGWFDQSQNPLKTIVQNTAQYVVTNKESPTPGSTTHVSFPTGTVEMKSGWRQLTQAELASGEFHTQTVRYYDTNGSGDTCYRDATWGMVGLHIIQKTADAPHFVYATFEQTDNIQTAAGDPVEDVCGKEIANQSAQPFDPSFTTSGGGGGIEVRLAQSAKPATTASIQAFSPLSGGACSPQNQIYFQESSRNTYQGNVCVNRRAHPIPQDVINVNLAAQEAIAAYNQANDIASSPWQHYKLVNVQYMPIDKPNPGGLYTGADAATYYQANSVIETDFNLQYFSGQFQPYGPPSSITEAEAGNLITDWNLDGTPFKNVYTGGHAYNMGGCMGCHGNAQVGGTDFSFIFGSRVREPEVPQPQTAVDLADYHVTKHLNELATRNAGTLAPGAAADEEK